MLSTKFWFFNLYVRLMSNSQLLCSFLNSNFTQRSRTLGSSNIFVLLLSRKTDFVVLRLANHRAILQPKSCGHLLLYDSIPSMVLHVIEVFLILKDVGISSYLMLFHLNFGIDIAINIIQLANLYSGRLWYLCMGLSEFRCFSRTSWAYCLLHIPRKKMKKTAMEGCRCRLPLREIQGHRETINGEPHKWRRQGKEQHEERRIHTHTQTQSRPVLDRYSTICMVKNIGISMVLSTILRLGIRGTHSRRWSADDAVCGWGDTCSVLVLHGIGSQYPPLIPKAGGGGQYSPPSSLTSRSPKPSIPVRLDALPDRRRCNLLFEISIQQILDSWL